MTKQSCFQQFIYFIIQQVLVKYGDNDQTMNNMVDNTMTNSTSTIQDYYNIESDSSDYSDTDESEDDLSTDDDLVCMKEEENQDTKYLAVFQNNSDEFDQQVISVENQEELKNLNYQ